MAEESITPPAKGDPITAAWAASLVAAVNGAHGADEEPDSLRTPDGLVSPPPCAEMMEAPPALPLPFDCRLVWNSAQSKHHIFVCLPGVSQWATDDGNGWVNESYVYADGRALAPWSGSNAQTVGTATNAWVDYGAINFGVDYRLMLYALQVGAGTTTEPSGPLATADSVERFWRLVLVQGSAFAPPVAVSARWDFGLESVCVARIHLPTSTEVKGDGEVSSVESLLRGCAQFHRGAIALPRKACVDSDAQGAQSIDRYAPAPGSSVESPKEVFELRNFAEGETESSFPNSFDIPVRKLGSYNELVYISGYTGTVSVKKSDDTTASLVFKNGILKKVT